ncbi:MAG: NTP transferase domain-containing protein [Syntrophobacteraceae bacterium]|nr:NTP transferase domain-containing protein [Syntrophobacteraceae bacterium]
MTGPAPSVASIVLAAGKGSRMTGYSGNKTLLPLIPEESPYRGRQPLLLEVLGNLPPGPAGIVVNHCADDVRQATRHLPVTYCHQPSTNGTGGALLAARDFIETVRSESVVITMGDVPLIRRETYARLVEQMESFSMVLLAFTPRDRAQYGMLEVEGDRVQRIVEWKYWKDYPQARQDQLRFCNAGVYSVRRPALVRYLDRLEAMPHTVTKQRGQEWVEIHEYFLTDLVELMSQDGLAVSLVVVDDSEVTGVDTPESLQRVQNAFAARDGRPVRGLSTGSG